jgi:hypothetical protein
LTNSYLYILAVTTQNKIQAGCQWLTPGILADQEDLGSKPAQGNSSPDPISKKAIHHKKWLVKRLKV